MFRVEIVTRAVQVDRQEVDTAEAVLFAVGLKHHQKRFLRDPIRRVRFFRIAGPEISLTKRHRCELRVGADGANLDELLDAATTSMLDQDPTLIRQPRYSDSGEAFYSPWWWWWNWYSRSELRDEKVVLFADYLGRGTYEYSYTMRATLPDDYKIIPTVASEFYFPEVFGRSDGRLLSIGK